MRHRAWITLIYLIDWIALAKFIRFKIAGFIFEWVVAQDINVTRSHKKKRVKVHLRASVSRGMKGRKVEI